MYDEFFEKARALRAAGVPFATATVVRAEKPTSGKPGDRAIITIDGTVHGWVGGSCAQPTVAEQAARAIVDGEPRLIRLSPEPGTKPVPDGIEEVPMTCFSGGTLDIFIEPHQPAPHLLIVGSLPVAQSLARLGKAMSYRVTAVDATGSDTMAHADDVLRDVADIASRVGPLTFAVVATHGDYDEPALKAILETAAPYVALVASRKRGEAVLESLAMDGLDDATRARVRFPAGLDIHARRGDEIAVSILAEIVQVRRNLGEVEWQDADAREASVEAAGADTEDTPKLGLVTLGAEPARQRGSTAPNAPTLILARSDPRAPGSGPASPAGARNTAVEPGTAIDPVCHMTVQIDGAMHTYEYEGNTYYFCCGGCRTRFARDPHKYIATG